MKLTSHQQHIVNDAALQAGNLIMTYRNDWLKDGFDVERKQDDSPVTEADKAADRHICRILERLTPDIPVISEEGSHNEAAAKDGIFWCVDPLDGTKTFIRGGKNFTVNIGLIYNFMPVYGVIVAPAHAELYYGCVCSASAYKSVNGSDAFPISTRPTPATHQGLTAFVSKHHGAKIDQQLKETYNITDNIAASSSIKFCRIAEGLGDIYPRFGPTMEWDTAAGHAILIAAGGRIDVMHDNHPLRYSKKGFLNSTFVAYGSA